MKVDYCDELSDHVALQNLTEPSSTRKGILDCDLLKEMWRGHRTERLVQRSNLKQILATGKFVDDVVEKFIRQGVHTTSELTQWGSGWRLQTVLG